MEKEQVAVDEAVETAVEQSARAYSKTVWTESTPITADKLNKIEDGIASALPLTGGTLTGDLTCNKYLKINAWPNYGSGTANFWYDGNNKTIKVEDATNLTLNGVSVSKEGHTHNYLPISGGTLTGKIDVPGESTFYKGTYVDPWENTECVIKASGKVGIGGALKVNEGLTVLGNVESPIFVATTDLMVNRHGFTSFYTNNQEGAHIFCNKNNSSITLKDTKMAYGNPNGNVEIGPQNSFHCHIYTDRQTFYFNKDLLVNGNKVYHEGNKPTAAAIGAMSTNGPTFSGNLNQNGPNGYDWIYHINADRGTLNIAPKINGNPEWGKQIYIDRNGQIHCNGNRRVATINQENPAHHMIRYGAGMGGADGYITFSW